MFCWSHEVRRRIWPSDRYTPCHASQRESARPQRASFFFSFLFPGKEERDKILFYVFYLPSRDGVIFRWTERTLSPSATNKRFPVGNEGGGLCEVSMPGPAKCFLTLHDLSLTPQWRAAGAEIKVQSVENTRLKGSPCNDWSRSVYSHTCYAYCQGFLPCHFLPFRYIHMHFFQTSPEVFLCWLWLTPVLL